MDTSPTGCNADYDWDRFDPEWYFDHNYRTLRGDDRQIAMVVRDFFAGCGVSGGRGIDVGAGANLYPAMSMLPFCDSIELCDLSAPNVAWLTRALERPGESWADFWALFAAHQPYTLLADGRARLSDVATARQASVFELPRHTWDIGTMFFVACSLSTDYGEFERAIACFVAALRPGAPFAAAFMEGSRGYDTGVTHFPAVSLYAEDVQAVTARWAEGTVVQRVVVDTPLREGYSGGMLVATGWSRG